MRIPGFITFSRNGRSFVTLGAWQPTIAISLLTNLCVFRGFGTPGVIRTPDPLLRRQVLYPAELRAHTHPLRETRLAHVRLTHFALVTLVCQSPARTQTKPADRAGALRRALSSRMLEAGPRTLGGRNPWFPSRSLSAGSALAPPTFRTPARSPGEIK